LRTDPPRCRRRYSNLQVGAWYNVCAVNHPYCPRAEVLAMNSDEAVDVFRNETPLAAQVVVGRPSRARRVF